MIWGDYHPYHLKKKVLSVTFTCLSQLEFDLARQPHYLHCPICHYLVLHYLSLPLLVTFFSSSRGSVEKTTNDGGWMVGGRMERQKQDMCLAVS